jgi:hypothetical protein
MWTSLLATPDLRIQAPTMWSLPGECSCRRRTDGLKRKVLEPPVTLVGLMKSLRRNGIRGGRVCPNTGGAARGSLVSRK